jgi:hypothetical protein
VWRRQDTSRFSREQEEQSVHQTSELGIILCRGHLAGSKLVTQGVVAGMR